MTRVLVTGANGFVGSALCRELARRALPARGAVRAGAAQGQLDVGALDEATDWRAALAGCEVVVHLAARVHVMHDGAVDPMREYRRVNVDATLNLARQAAAAGVRRFVFVSSIKVHGESSGERPLCASDAPAPTDPYGHSKREAEDALRALTAQCAMELVIVRPPLVYGPGVKANFRKLIELAGYGLPLPFGRVDNRRSMVALDNLVDLLIACTSHPAAAGQTLLVSDDADLSLADLVRLIGAAMGRRVWLLPVPPAWLMGAARLAGKGAAAQRLLGNLQVDIAPTRSTLGWAPVVTPAAAIAATVADCQRGGAGSGKLAP